MSESSPQLYLAAIETISAVYHGLNPTPEDEILTICASLDYAAAFLEAAKKVVAADINPTAIELARTRANDLAVKDYDAFLRVDLERDGCVGVRARNRYFREGHRLERIYQNIEALEILEPQSIEAAASSANFDKIYASNTVGCWGCVYDEDVSRALKTFSKSLRKNGLLYITGHFPKWEHLAPEGLVLDKRLTSLASKLELEKDFWHPRVFRKMD